jgi:hypothetical protein
MENSDVASNDIWDILIDKLLNITDDNDNYQETDAELSSPSSSAHSQSESNAEKLGRKGHVRQNSDVVKLIERDDIWSKGSARLAIQKHNSWGRRSSLQTVSENGLEESENGLEESENGDIRKLLSPYMFLIANSQCLEEIFVLKMWLLQFSKLG